MKIKTKFNIWLYNIINNHIYRIYDLYFNSEIRKQQLHPETIPVIIINYNQLFYLKQLVNFLIKRNFKNIIIIDNKSSYKPLLSYYKEIEKQITLEVMDENYGHAVFIKNIKLQQKYGKGFFIMTDSDIVPNKNLPDDFLLQMLNLLKRHWEEVTKVGFALQIDDIPNANRLKDKILSWEKNFWEVKMAENIYIAPLDTTFALYKPGYPRRYDQVSYLDSLRMGGKFTAKHGGWYLDQSNLTAEQRFYINTASISSSWLQENKNEKFDR